ncbi:MAG: type III deoxyribonuclease [Treponema sp.]|nr:MAG: type III deoxyribonuclease [Treponema sp.]
MAFLYEQFENPFVKPEIEKVSIPDYIKDNLKFEQRTYQEEAFKRFIFFDNKEFEGKPNKPIHLAYNMATGSGKTLIMAGLILYLYKKGYRNFIFFVNSNNIIQKTKDNFLNSQSSKYLFNNKIIINNNKIIIKEVNNFDESDPENVNIKFTTIQQLHLDLNTVKENSVTYEDFTNKKTALIADEAHHLNSGTKQGDLFGSWEGTVINILNKNYRNILLEFTATLNYEQEEIKEKYENKVIFKYDLAQYRKDKYSKEINLLRSEYNEEDRIIQTLILNLYRQELATAHNINLKPVILFKAKQTIKESEQNKKNFHNLIENLSEEMIEKVKKTSTVSIIQKAFIFFNAKNISNSEIIKRTKFNFKEENCLSANNDNEAKKNQILLNTLEDKNNPIRAIFAVQKLNEGWDVLNLFDIVRLYDTRDSKNGTPGKTTIAEAQLIGRGARYYPFALDETEDKYTRKFDDDITNDLKVLEELYYHTKEDSRYISELKKALIDSGIYEDEDNLEKKQLKLKLDFKKTNFYNNSKVWFNKKAAKDFKKINSFNDLGIKNVNTRYELASGEGYISKAFSDDENNKTLKIQKDINLSEIPRHIIKYALSANPFFYFKNISHYFPNIKSISNFINSTDYLGNLGITFIGNTKRLEAITHNDYLYALNKLLNEIEKEIKNNSTKYEATDYYHKPLKEIFTDKEIKINRYSERAKGQEEFLAKQPWYAYNANYGTKEEKKFVELFARRFKILKNKYDDIYLIRNERELKIFDKKGRAFEPDFLLFCKEKNKDAKSFQVFIEPKGIHLIGYDKWKEDFLKKIAKEKRTIRISTDTYLITAVPFYNYESENKFSEKLDTVLKI